ncbi:hypothetical protein ACIBIZ_11495 [Nonomuraea spiralis]|uniref:hypothetical protein n=1 Tax=Nonomuraea spiralis TaxID=46182 RepID=UPI0037872B56
METAAIDQVREIGETLAQANAELTYDGTVQVVDIVLLDVGTATSDEALEVAHNRLLQQGWRDRGTGPNLIQMTSPRWEQVALSIGPISRLRSLKMQLDSKTEQMLRSGSSRINDFVVIDLSTTDLKSVVSQIADG